MSVLGDGILCPFWGGGGTLYGRTLPIRFESPCLRWDGFHATCAAHSLTFLLELAHSPAGLLILYQVARLKIPPLFTRAAIHILKAAWTRLKET